MPHPRTLLVGSEAAQALECRQCRRQPLLHHSEHAFHKVHLLFERVERVFLSMIAGGCQGLPAGSSWQRLPESVGPQPWKHPCMECLRSSITVKRRRRACRDRLVFYSLCMCTSQQFSHLQDARRGPHIHGCHAHSAQTSQQHHLHIELKRELHPLAQDPQPCRSSQHLQLAPHQLSSSLPIHMAVLAPRTLQSLTSLLLKVLIMST
mmetsp:Transcript_29411/g.51565  ORF Transcript_29411/g.51565 Transcript_29411/m.51565 type:complete len:207 (-) Transcript_29411:29-649(-)